MKTSQPLVRTCKYTFLIEIFEKNGYNEASFQKIISNREIYVINLNSRNLHACIHKCMKICVWK